MFVDGHNSDLTIILAAPACVACDDEADLLHCSTTGVISPSMRKLFRGVPTGSGFQLQESDAARDDTVQQATTVSTTKQTKSSKSAKSVKPKHSKNEAILPIVPEPIFPSEEIWNIVPLPNQN